MKIWKDNVWQEPDVANDIVVTAGFQFGYGLFETVRVRRGRPLDLEAHLVRMTASIAALDSEIPHPFDKDKLSEVIFGALEKYEEADGALKIISCRGGTSWMSFLSMRPFPYCAADYERGFSLRQAKFTRNPASLLVNHKSINYLENYLERLEAKRAGYDEVFFLNPAGVVTEGAASNIFMVADDVLVTSPPGAGLLPGIMRAKIFAVSSTLGLNMREEPITVAEFVSAKGVIVTNALLGAMPVSYIGDSSISIDRELISALNQALDR